VGLVVHFFLSGLRDHRRQAMAKAVRVISILAVAVCFCSLPAFVPGPARPARSMAPAAAGALSMLGAAPAFADKIDDAAKVEKSYPFLKEIDWTSDVYGKLPTQPPLEVLKAINTMLKMGASMDSAALKSGALAHSQAIANMDSKGVATLADYTAINGLLDYTPCFFESLVEADSELTKYGIGGGRQEQKLLLGLQALLASLSEDDDPAEDGEEPGDDVAAVVTLEQAKASRGLAAAHTLKSKVALILKDHQGSKGPEGFKASKSWIRLVDGKWREAWVVPLSEELPPWGHEPAVVECKSVPEKVKQATLKVTIPKAFQTSYDWDETVRKPASAVRVILPDDLAVRSYGWHKTEQRDEAISGFLKLPESSSLLVLRNSGSKGVFVKRVDNQSDPGKRVLVKWLPIDKMKAPAYYAMAKREADKAKVSLAYRAGGGSCLGLIGVSPGENDEVAPTLIDGSLPDDSVEVVMNDGRGDMHDDKRGQKQLTGSREIRLHGYLDGILMLIVRRTNTSTHCVRKRLRRPSGPNLVLTTAGLLPPRATLAEVPEHPPEKSSDDGASVLLRPAVVGAGLKTTNVETPTWYCEECKEHVRPTSECKNLGRGLSQARTAHIARRHPGRPSSDFPRIREVATVDAMHQRKLKGKAAWKCFWCRQGLPAMEKRSREASIKKHLQQCKKAPPESTAGSNLQAWAQELDKSHVLEIVQECFVRLASRDQGLQHGSSPQAVAARRNRGGCTNAFEALDLLRSFE
ncbi:unnamed protein product, partial [Symbiodinium microadriaticum]